MLGMMNCPTENVEFYSASPALKRVIAGRRCAGSDDASTTASSSSSADDKHQLTIITNPTTMSKCDDAAKQSTASGAKIDVDEEVGDEEDVVRVFTEARHRPQVTYTTDGRKLLNGKLYSIDTDASTIDPLKMWDRLIMSSVAVKLNQHQQDKKPSRRWSVITAAGDATSIVTNVESKLAAAETNERELIDKTKKYRRTTHQKGAAFEELIIDDLSNNVNKISCASL